MSKVSKVLKNLRYTNKPLLLFSLILFIFGLIMVFSASNISAFMRYGTDPYHYVITQGKYLLMGLALFLVVINIDSKQYIGLCWLGLLLGAGLLIGAYLFGPEINESKGWINLGFVQFQPSEIIKVVIIAWFATFFEIKKLAYNKISPSMFVFGIALGEAGLVVVGGDFGTAAIIVLMIYLMYFLVPVKLDIKLKTIFIYTFFILILLCGYFLLDTSKFQRQIGRFQNFGEPCSPEKFEDKGNQVCNSIIAFNNGGLLGKGLGNSTQKYLYLPESHTDFIFAIVVEETGFVGGAVVLLTFMVVIFLVIRTGVRSRNFRGSMICYGVAIYMFLHIAINLGGISGLIPLTGVPLPFISYGGTFTICLIGALSMVQRVEIETKLARKLDSANKK